MRFMSEKSPERINKTFVFTTLSQPVPEVLSTELMFSMTCFICAAKSPTANLPLASKAGGP